MIRIRDERGMTIIEMVVASLIAIIFMLAAATGYLVNQKSYDANRDKLELQQTASHVMEIMERRVREAYSVRIPNPPERIQTFDSLGVEITRFRLNTNSGTAKLFEQDALLAKQKLISLQFLPNADTTVVTILLNLEDIRKNRVAIRASATLRNHQRLRFLEPAPVN